MAASSPAAPSSNTSKPGSPSCPDTSSPTEQAADHSSLPDGEQLPVDEVDVTMPVKSTGELLEDKTMEADLVNSVEQCVGDKLLAVEPGARSSRRKQQKTHKVVETVALSSSNVVGKSTDNYVDADLAEYVTAGSVMGVDGELDDALSLLKPSLPLSSTSLSQTSATPAQKSARLPSVDESSSDDTKEDSLVLPEGTVFVQPESVDSSPIFHEIESSRTKSKFRGNLDTAILHCTACHRQIGSDSNTAVQRHPVLKVLICQKCHKTYNSSNIEQDVDGSDEQCRWCGQGGDLICCDYCHNAICKTCIRRNLGRKELSSILSAGEGERWRCYVCDPKPLLGLIEHCTSVMEALTRQEKQESERRRKTIDAANKAVAGSIQLSTTTSNKTSVSSAGTGGQLLAQAVSVIQSASSSSVSRSKTKVSNTAAEKQAPVPTKAPRMVSAVQAVPAPAMTRQPVPNAVSQQPFVIGTVSSRPAVPAQQVRSPPPLHPVVNANNVLGVLDRLLSATNSMQVFLQSLRADARKCILTDSATVQVEKRREIAGKLARAYSAYARTFSDAASQCRAPSNTNNSSVAPGSMPPRLTGPRMVSGVVRCAVPPRPGNPSTPGAVQAPNQGQPVRPPIVNSEVIELSDSDDEHAGDNNNEVISGKDSKSDRMSTPRVAPPANAKSLLVSHSAPSKITSNPVVGGITKKRMHSQEPATGSGNTPMSAKRIRQDDGGTKHKSSTSEDGSMFDGGVDEIPADDCNTSSDEHHLQMYCVEVNEDDDSDDTKPKEPKVVMLTNGRKSSARTAVVEDCNRNKESCKADLNSTVKAVPVVRPSGTTSAVGS
jgi:transcriptional regulator ATRX